MRELLNLRRPLSKGENDKGMRQQIEAKKLKRPGDGR